MKVIYTLINPDDNLAYVGQTNSFSRRLSEHLANGLFVALQIPTTAPLFVLLKTGKLIIKVFISSNPNSDEKRTRKSASAKYKMINKTFK